MAREIDLMVMQGYSLCTCEIFYFFPDRPSIIAPPYIFQQYDLAPKFPELRKFLDWWSHNLEGRLHSVKVATERLIRPAEYRFAAAEFGLH